MFNTDIYKQKLSTSILGHKFIYAESIGSTNDEIWNTEHGNHNGLVLVAEEQTKGRGRSGHTWFSSINKSLTFSILVNLSTVKINNGFIPISTGLAVCKTINDSIVDKVSIKWPNDVLVNDKKICGILCETKMIGTNQFMVIGLGININQLSGDFPLSIVDNVTSLAIAQKSKASREMFLATLLSNIESSLFKEDFLNTKKRWDHYCDHIDKDISFHQGNRKFYGIFSGINRNGEAIIRINNKLNIFSSGVIEYENTSS